MRTINTTSNPSTEKDLEGFCNSWRHRVINAIFDVLLVWDSNQARRAMKVTCLSDWSWTAPKLTDFQKKTFEDNMFNLQKITNKSTEEGFSIKDLEWFLKNVNDELAKASKVHAALEAEVTAKTCKLNAIDLQKTRIEMHFERSHMLRLVDILTAEIGRRNEIAKKLREEAQKRENERQAALKAQEEQQHQNEINRIAYLNGLRERALAKKHAHYVPPVKRNEFKTSVTSFEELANISNRKQGKFVSVVEITKSEALELAGIDAKAFAKAYSVAKTTPDSAIVVLNDASVISFVKSGAATRYIVRA